jgi:hypothetical protein
MHRLRIVIAGALVSALPLVTYQVAAASSSGTAGQSSDFCGAAQELQGEIQSLDDIDLETVSISDVRTTYRTYVDLVKQLQKETPKELKNTFKRLRAFYDKVADGKLKLDITSEKSIRRFARDVEKAGNDVERLFTYLEDECGISFTTETTTSAPTG